MPREKKLKYFAICFCVLLLVLWILVSIIFARYETIQRVKAELKIQFATLIIDAKVNGKLKDYSNSMKQEAFVKLQGFNITGSEVVEIHEEESNPNGFKVTLNDGRYFILRIEDDYGIGVEYLIFFSRLANFYNVSDNYLLDNTKIIYVDDLYSLDE